MWFSLELIIICIFSCLITIVILTFSFLNYYHFQILSLNILFCIFLLPFRPFFFRHITKSSFVTFLLKNKKKKLIFLFFCSFLSLYLLNVDTQCFSFVCNFKNLDLKTRKNSLFVFVCCCVLFCFCCFCSPCVFLSRLIENFGSGEKVGPVGKAKTPIETEKQIVFEFFFFLSSSMRASFGDSLHGCLAFFRLRNSGFFQRNSLARGNLLTKFSKVSLAIKLGMKIWLEFVV